MNKEERRLKYPLSLRFEDWGELYATWGIIEKILAIVFLPFVLLAITFYTMLCEVDYCLVTKRQKVTKKEKQSL